MPIRCNATNRQDIFGHLATCRDLGVNSGLDLAEYHSLDSRHVAVSSQCCARLQCIVGRGLGPTCPGEVPTTEVRLLLLPRL